MLFRSATGLPDAEARRVARLADLLGTWPEAEVVLRPGCVRPGDPGPGSGAAGTVDGIGRARMDAVRSALVARGVPAQAVAKGDGRDQGIGEPADAEQVAPGRGGGCIRIELRMDRSSLPGPDGALGLRPESPGGVRTARA